MDRVDPPEPARSLSAIPTPVNSGASGTQVEGPQDTVKVLPADPFAGIVNAFSGLAEGRPRAMGGDTAAPLIHGLITTLHAEALNAKASAERKQDKIDELKEDISRERAANAGMKALIADMRRSQTISQLCMTSAAILIGVSVDAMKTDARNLAIVAGIVAAALLIGSWLIPRNKGANNE